MSWTNPHGKRYGWRIAPEPTHYRASFATTTPCKVIGRPQDTPYRSDVTCPDCLTALAKSDARMTDPEARGR